MKFNLDQIEARLQAFVENNRVFSRRNNSLAQKLVEAMQDNMVPGTTGAPMAPNSYVLTIHPKTLKLWQSSPELFERLAEVLHAAAGDAGVRFIAPLTIRLRSDPSVSLDGLEVTASASAVTPGSTAAMPVLNDYEVELQDSYPPGAFLIVNGQETFPLRQPVVNLGRRLDNHVIISDVRVSRAHAQLRAIRGRYVLFDLNSSGGTYVNGLRITQQTLKPGDVISLAGVPIIYSEETPIGASDTSAYNPYE